ncbi:MAG TPA: hypothetical protein VFP93_02875 [Gammaproteobacteria bacterium]|nr:hypothetical protein [Gammaproteobacteria bacterium]
MFLQEYLENAIAEKNCKEVENLLLLFPSLAYENSAESYFKKLAQEKDVETIKVLWVGSDFGFDPLTYPGFEFLHQPEYESVKAIVNNNKKQRISETASLPIAESIRKWLASVLYVLTNIEPMYSTRTLKFASTNQTPQAISAPHLRFNLKSKEQAAALKRLLWLFDIPCYGGMKNHFFLVTIPLTSFENIYRMLQGLTHFTRVDLNNFWQEGYYDEEYTLLFNFCFNLREEMESIKMRAKNAILGMESHQIEHFIQTLTASVELKIKNTLQSRGILPLSACALSQEKIEFFSRLLNIPQFENNHLRGLQKTQKIMLLQVLFNKELQLPESKQTLSKVEFKQFCDLYRKTLCEHLSFSYGTQESIAQIANTFTPGYYATQFAPLEEDSQPISKKRKFSME